MKKVIISLMAMGFIGSAAAATSTANINARARMLTNCIVSATNIEFGDITPTTATAQHASAIGSVKVKCNKSTSYTIYQNWGSVGNETARLLKGATSATTTRYFVCTAPGVAADQCVEPNKWWPNGFNGVHNNKVTATADGTEKTHNVYGYILKVFVRPDIYSDTLTTQIVF